MKEKRKKEQGMNEIIEVLKSIRWSGNSFPIDRILSIGPKIEEMIANSQLSKREENLFEKILRYENLLDEINGYSSIPVSEEVQTFGELNDLSKSAREAMEEKERLGREIEEILRNWK